MKAFRIGPVLAQCAPDGRAWLVTRGAWLRVAATREEAELVAREMATELGQPLDASNAIADG